MRFCVVPFSAAVLLAQGPRPGVPTTALPPVLQPWDAEVRTKEVDNQPFPAHRIAGNLYYVGTAGYASFLVTSAEGHILINPDYDDSVPLIQKSVAQLGFRFHDIKIVLISHAHGDHCGGAARVKEATGAQVMVMDRDVEAVEAGRGFPAVEVSRVLHDLDEVGLGGNLLTAHLTPGHTKGNTTWTLQVREGGRAYNVVIVGSAGVNDARALSNNPSYPDMVEDYRRTFRVLHALPVDIFLASHGTFYGLAAKYARLSKGGPNPFIDPAGYRAHVDLTERAFYYKLDWVHRQ